MKAPEPCVLNSGGISGRPGFEKLLFPVNHGVYIVGCQFDAVAVGNSVGGASFNTVPAENAARIVNIINACVTLTRRDSLGFCIFRSLDVNAICGTRSGTQKATNALFKAVLISLKYVDPPIARLHRGGDIRKALRRRLSEHGTQRNAEAFK
jgi:hypothetical protein